MSIDGYPGGGAVWGSSKDDVYIASNVLFHYARPCLKFKLLKELAYKPSNIYLFFSVEPDDGSEGAGEPIVGLNEKDFEIYEDDKLISQYAE